MMRSSLVVLVALLGGCGGGRWVVTNNYTASLTATAAPQNALAVEIPAELSYSEDLEASRIGVEEAKSAHTRAFVPLRLKIVNPTPDIITIDWDHSAFVDDAGNSYKLLYPGSSQLPSSVEAIKKPPTPVIAPRAHLVVAVHPDTDLSDGSSYVPWMAGERRDLRIVLATSGVKSAHSEWSLAVECERVEAVRESSAPWPKHGDRCLPLVGCAEGIKCDDGVCVEPGKPRPVPPSAPTRVAR